ncbi:MAG TPA: hypothetical protein VF943_11050 [Burkholderiales bacterium]
MQYLLVLSFALLTLAGCAGMDATQCRSANWYDLAFRDAIFGLQPQDEIYARQCDPHGVQLDRARYREGWIHGYYEQQRRISQSVD